MNRLALIALALFAIPACAPEPAPETAQAEDPYLWLEEGTHRVVLYLGGYRTYDEKITIQPGAVVNLKLKLLPGESTPPKVG